ncbi:MAG: hypothetical protein M3O01_11235 [Pseudomonadota bacterium]|nr:hypothetical protein [Pseudomonadota bacterium]
MPDAEPRQRVAVEGPPRLPRLAGVLAVARRLAVTDPAEAAGRCLALSLEMANAARTSGLEVNLVVWRVLGDTFADHWAVAIAGSWVIDLTRVQVDGRAGVLHRIDNYPVNYRCRALYPATLWAPVAAAVPRTRQGLDGHFAWAIRRRMFRHDLRRAARQRDARLAARSTLSLLRFVVAQGLQRWSTALEARRSTLRERLDGGLRRP